MGEAKGKMNGYVALLMLRYGNLCVKADAASLLSVSVKDNEQECDIEQVADVGILSEDVIAVVPKKSSLLNEIGKGVMKAHPEFKMDIVKAENWKEEENQYLTFTMPEMEEVRRDLLNAGVDTLNSQCVTKLNAIFSLYSAKIALKTVNMSPETIKEVNDKLKEIADFYNDTCKSQTDTKKKEIEDAYQKYLAEKEAKLQEKKEEAAAHSKEVSQRMKMDNMGENEY